MLSLRRFLARAFVGCALALPSMALLVPSDAAASVSVAMPLEALVKDADVVAFVTAGEPKAVWEDGRIYTYTAVKFDQGVAGDVAAGSDGWIRTMGGVVGKIGQHVDGEAVFVKDKSSLLFLRKFAEGGVYEVSARAQGQYPVVIDEKTKAKKVIRSSVAGVLVPPTDAAAAKLLNPPNASTVKTQSIADAPVKTVDASKIRLAHLVLHDRPADDVAREVASEWKRLHAATVPTK
jgi:hypothetical protein